ncbi:unnamed protein product [Symbiodinium sp. CCMP2456]|nr:unnamed protein product [Symbiodinium sp. CCMP2456]
MSAAGKRLKEEGRTASVFICHAKRHVEKRTPLIIIENTKFLRIQMLRAMFGEHYTLHILHCSTEAVGHAGAKRDRVYVILAHKQQTSLQHNPQDLYDNIAQAIATRVATSPKDYFVATNTDIHLHMDAICRKRKRHLTAAAVDKLRRDASHVDCSFILNAREKKVVAELDKEYRKRYNADPNLDANLVYHLGDSAAYRTWSAPSNSVPTLKRSSGLLWSPKRKRCMTSRELLATLGFPVTKATARAMMVPELPILDSNRASRIAGNAMHWSSVGVVQLVALSCFRPASIMGPRSNKRGAPEEDTAPEQVAPSTRMRKAGPKIRWPGGVDPGLDPEDDADKPPAGRKGTKPAYKSAPKKTSKRFDPEPEEDDEADDDEQPEKPSKVPKKAKAAPKKIPKRAAAETEDDDDEEEEEATPKKKPKASAKTKAAAEPKRKAAPNCHFADWLAEIEPILLNKSVTKKMDRDTHFILLAFCFGWQAQDEPCERVKADMLRAAKNEYIRRGSPLHHTAWSVSDIRAYMTARWAAADDDEDVGPFASELPAAPATGGPAPLPDWVKAHLAEEAQASEEEGDADDDDDELPDSGYCIEKRKVKGKGIVWILRLDEQSKSVELGPPEKGNPWEIYVEEEDDGQKDFLWQGEDGGMDGEECSEVMAQLLHAEKDAHIGKQKAVAAQARNKATEPADKGPRSSTGHPGGSTAVPDDEFGGSSSESPGFADAEEKDPPPLMPFVFTQDGKQWLLDAKQMRELALPGVDKAGGSDDWKVAQEWVGGKINYVLGCDTAERPRHCDVLMAGRKSKDITDPARKEAAQKHVSTHEEAVKRATVQKQLREQRESEARAARERAEREAEAERLAAVERAKREKAEKAEKADNAETQNPAAAVTTQQQSLAAFVPPVPPGFPPEHMGQLLSSMMTFFAQHPQGPGATMAAGLATATTADQQARETKEKEEREAKEKEEQTKRLEKEEAEREEHAKREAKEKAEREAQEKEEQTKRLEKEEANREEHAKREAKEKAEREAKEAEKDDKCTAKEKEDQPKRAKTTALSPSLAANMCDLDADDDAP